MPLICSRNQVFLVRITALLILSFPGRRPCEKMVEVKGIDAQIVDDPVPQVVKDSDEVAVSQHATSGTRCPLDIVEMDKSRWRFGVKSSRRFSLHYRQSSQIMDNVRISAVIVEQNVGVPSLARLKNRLGWMIAADCWEFQSFSSAYTEVPQRPVAFDGIVPWSWEKPHR